MRVKQFEVTLRFQYPAWGEDDGIPYYVRALCKHDAIRIARWHAKRDGHMVGSKKGRRSFRVRKID